MTINWVYLENPFMLQERRAELLVTAFLTFDFGTPFLKVSNEKYSYSNILSIKSSRYVGKCTK
jgi:hypothetical protein